MQRVKNDCTLSTDYYNINQLNYFILYYYKIINYGEPSQPKPETELQITLFCWLEMAKNKFEGAAEGRIWAPSIPATGTAVELHCITMMDCGTTGLDSMLSYFSSLSRML